MGFAQLNCLAHINGIVPNWTISLIHPFMSNFRAKCKISSRKPQKGRGEGRMYGIGPWNPQMIAWRVLFWDGSRTGWGNIRRMFKNETYGRLKKKWPFPGGAGADSRGTKFSLLFFNRFRFIQELVKIALEQFVLDNAVLNFLVSKLSRLWQLLQKMQQLNLRRVRRTRELPLCVWKSWTCSFGKDRPSGRLTTKQYRLLATLVDWSMQKKKTGD